MSSPEEMSCPELADSVSAYLESELDPRRAGPTDCPPPEAARGCRLLVAQSRSLVEALRGLEDAPASRPTRRRSGSWRSSASRAPSP